MIRALSLLVAGLLAASALAADPQAFGPLEPVQEGFVSLDTPSWLPSEKCLLFTDLEQKKLYRLDGGKISVAREGASRGKVGPDGYFYGVLDGVIARWKPGGEKEVILAKAPGDKEIQLNDLAISSKGFLYYTTLKDPAKGRLTVVDLAKKSATVAFDGETEASLTNPNGVALSPDEKHLYVGISSYASKSHSGVYRFPIQADGTLDVAAGKQAKWAAVAGPDGIAVDKAGNVWFTAGAVVQVYSADGKKAGTLKIPKASGTNLAFGEDQRILFVTTKQGLYQAKLR